MKTRNAALIVVLLILPISVSALQTDELVKIAAMPLAVAAVADLADVPTSDLITVVSALNRADVPPPQFVEVVRYVPVALVDRRQPTFVEFVTTRVEEGLVGDELAFAIADRIGTTYEIREIDVVDPPEVVVVERRELIPAVVTTRVQTTRFDPVALVAMPLAVAAVAELTDVPAGDLITFIAALNQAAVPPPQFVEVVRYSPVVFVDRSVEPRFIQFVTTEVDRGIRGDALAFAIANRIRTVGVADIDVVRPRRFVRIDRTELMPPIVRRRVARLKEHPHGGPPGQLEKVLGVQTGAEIVHQPASRKRIVVRRDRDDGRDRRRNESVRERRGDDDDDDDHKRRVTERGRDGNRNSGNRNDGRDGGDKGKSKGKGKGKKD